MTDSLYGITPHSVKKALAEILPQPFANGSDQKPATEYEDVSLAPDEYLETIDESEAKMKRLAEALKFEKSAELRNRIEALRGQCTAFS